MTDTPAPPQPQITIEQFREFINLREAMDPLVFLESLMAGQDPRTLATLHHLVEEITEFDDGTDLPTIDEWETLTRLIRTKYRYHPVSLQESQQAATTLMRHLHPTLKQVHANNTNIDMTSAEPAAPPPLNEAEVRLFLRAFGEEFGNPHP